MQQYLQQVRPLSECDAEDGRLVGKMLINLVAKQPKDLGHAIREFANCTAMLRECCFRHIGDMLVTLLIERPTTDAATPLRRLTTVHTTTSEDLDLLRIGQNDAAALGGALASSMHLASALHEAVNAHPVLLAMKVQYAWFVPMLEALLTSRSRARRSSMRVTFMPRSGIAPEEANEANLDSVISDAANAGDTSGVDSFVSVVMTRSLSYISCCLEEFAVGTGCASRCLEACRCQSWQGLFAQLLPRRTNLTTLQRSQGATNTLRPWFLSTECHAHWHMLIVMVCQTAIRSVRFLQVTLD
jgi:hypothetical protein